ncbi:MAG TPA: hypothetical protein VFI73_06385 [Candidatus Nitrosopolaris sp.]|nr:hypothetical protein [Candidatus Nitrosopolaris sp.]
MNENKKTKPTRTTTTKMTRPSRIIVAATIVAVVASAVLIFGLQTQIAQKAIGQSSYNVTAPVARTFWIKTVHLDGFANTNGIPTGPDPAPPEKYPNSTIPAGGGFVLTPPDKTGAWKFRAFTFEPSTIIVHQGDNVTLHFADVQGAHYVIKVDGVGSFSVSRGQIHTLSFVAEKLGTINYYSPQRLPNMVGQIWVLPKTS